MSKRTQPYRYGVPAKYLSGLSDSAAKKRAAEIKRTAKAYREGKKVNLKAIQKSRVEKKETHLIINCPRCGEPLLPSDDMICQNKKCKNYARK